MNKYKVWDKINEEESDGVYLEAFDAEEAAIQYAENDVDGHIDGLYSGNDGQEKQNVKEEGHELCVMDENGKVVVCRTGIIEFNPVYAAYEVKV